MTDEVRRRATDREREFAEHITDEAWEPRLQNELWQASEAWTAELHGQSTCDRVSNPYSESGKNMQTLKSEMPSQMG